MGAVAFIVFLWVLGSCQGGDTPNPGKNYTPLECEVLRVDALTDGSDSREDSLVQYNAYC